MAASGAKTPEKRFDVDYLVEMLPSAGVAAVSITVTPDTGRLIELDFAMDPERYRDISGEGSVRTEDGRTVWRPPRKGGTLRYRYTIDKQRRGDGYDARITGNWVIVRGDHLVPAARVRMTKDARSRARLRFALPAGWTNVDTPYLSDGDAAAFIVENPERSFARPVGWMIAGDVGTRREWIEGMEISVAAPKGDAMRRNDILAFANMVAPEMKRAFGQLPPKLLIVGAGDPMWRGGLSGPQSLYMHTARPLISENGTSTLVHELVHVVTRIGGAGNDRWIGEGIAEYYSIELMRRAGLLSERRAALALDWMRHHGRNVKTLLAPRSSGPRTARAVTVFLELDAELRALTGGQHDLDDLVRTLMPLRKVNREQLAEAFERLAGKPSAVLQAALPELQRAPRSG
ncbi:MAG: hypothetical protein DIU71_01080 [Proteobacteria bacterium]|nr:MAG: hypothetical protein DIU71_01080 [Pseudomonadota bacterium]